MSGLLTVPSLRRWWGAFVLCSAALLWGGCASPEAGKTHVDTKGMSPAQVTPNEALRVGDLVIINYSGVTDPPPKHEERIKADGHITLPYIGAVEAAGKTRGQVQEDILSAYVPKYYKRLTVVISSEARFFYVEGQVKSPGRYPHLGEMSVLRCVAAAGDFTDFAKRSKVQITRANGQKMQIDCIDAQNHPDKDLPVYPDDHIFVPRRIW